MVVDVVLFRDGGLVYTSSLVVCLAHCYASSSLRVKNLGMYWYMLSPVIRRLRSCYVVWLDS